MNIEHLREPYFEKFAIKHTDGKRYLEGPDEIIFQWFQDNLKEEWINVEERLPIVVEYDRYLHVIAIIDGETRTDIVYDKELKHFQSNWDTTSNSPLKVTHWRELPQPPTK